MRRLGRCCLSLLLLLPLSWSFMVSRFPQRRNFLADHSQLSVAVPMETTPGAAVVADEPEDPKLGVLLLNLGGPETGDDVEG